MVKRFFIVLMLSFMFLLQGSLAFADRVGPIVKGCQVGMTKNEATKVINDLKLYFKDMDNLKYCYGFNQDNMLKQIISFSYNNNNEVYRIKFNTALFSNLDISLDAFAQQFANEFKCTLNKNVQRDDSGILWPIYYYEDTTTGYAVKIIGKPNARILTDFYIYRINKTANPGSINF